MTPLEALNDLRDCGQEFNKAEFNKRLDIIETALKRLEVLIEEKTSFDRQLEKKLKALEIIVKKGVAVGMLQLKEVELQEYNDFIGDKKLYLTQEEFDLLKEVME